MKRIVPGIVSCMCRFALYLGSPILVSALVTEPTHSIIKQSFKSREREEPLNGDGFGIAWCAPEICDEPAIFKDVTPAWNNVNLANLARVTRTSCLLAHVRAATPELPVTTHRTFGIVSDGGSKPVRCRFRGPSFVNLGILAHLTEGALLADLIAVNASLDIVLGEIDR